MKQIIRLAVFLVACLILPNLERLHSQEQRPLLSLDQLVDEVMQANPEIKAAEQKWHAAQRRQAQVSALPDPLFSYTRFISNVETRVGPQENVLVLSQRIPFPGKLGLQGDMADQSALVEQREYAIVRREVIFKAKSAYYDLYWVDRSIEILDSYLQLLQDFARVAEQKYATGKGSQAHVLKSHVESSTILERKLGLQKIRQQVVEKMNALLNRPPGSEPGRPAAPDSLRPALDQELLVEKALAQRQELHTVEARISRSKLMKRLAKKEYWPDFNIQANYIDVSKGMSTAPDAGKDAWSVMVGVNLPIWLGRRNAAVNEAEETIAANNFMYENVRNQIIAEIRELVYRIELTAETLDLYEQGLIPQGESSLESALASYRSGRLDFLDLLDSQRMLLSFRLAYVKEQAAYRKNLADLERAVGGERP